MSSQGLPSITVADPKPWAQLSAAVAFQNRWLTVAVDQVLLPTGQTYEYTRLEPAGIGVGVIGFNAAGEILLEREYRHGVGEVIWQLPGGLATPAEDLAQAGLRELEEETGFAPALLSPETFRYLGMVWDNPAFGPMCSHLYVAWGLMPTGAIKRDPQEFVTLHWVSVEWLKVAVRTGAIKDRVVIAAVTYLILNNLLLTLRSTAG